MAIMMYWNVDTRNTVVDSYKTRFFSSGSGTGVGVNLKKKKNINININKHNSVVNFGQWYRK